MNIQPTNYLKNTPTYKIELININNEKITEIIFALPNTVEGKTTQHYIMSVIGDDVSVRFTELASGVPLGGDLDYLDDGTLTLAFGGRKSL